MKKKIRIAAVALAAVALIALAVFGAGQIRKQSPFNTFTTDHFFFASPLIADGQSACHLTNVTYGSGYYYIDIPVCNFYDALRVNEQDIRYTARIASSRNCTPSIRSGADGLLEGGTQKTDTIRVQVGGYTAASRFTVEISATAPYKQTLSFSVSPTDTFCTLVTDTSEYAFPYGDNAMLLQVEYGSAPPAITASWNGGTICVDTSSDAVSTLGTGNYKVSGKNTTCYNSCYVATEMIGGKLKSTENPGHTLTVCFMRQSGSWADGDIKISVNGGSAISLTRNVRTNITNY